ncbi:MAG TPA: hypothetical protein VGA10_09555, partial [Thermoanaerobaculia bacterium]
MAELAYVLGADAPGKYIAMLHARCDESYGSDIAVADIYVVGGLIGEREQWELFDSLWQEDVKSLKITGIGLHASKCANGAKPYEGMSVEERDEIQYRLIV